MRENKVTIVIDRPIEDVFEFTTNPKNTHLWIPSIEEEVADSFPPTIGTEYKNRGTDMVWDLYTVVEYEPGKTFTLADQEGNYHVRYSYKQLDVNKTELEYFEWMENGDLSDPFTQDILSTLKVVMERGASN